MNMLCISPTRLLLILLVYWKLLHWAQDHRGIEISWHLTTRAFAKPYALCDDVTALPSLSSQCLDTINPKDFQNSLNSSFLLFLLNMLALQISWRKSMQQLVCWHQPHVRTKYRLIYSITLGLTVHALKVSALQEDVLWHVPWELRRAWLHPLLWSQNQPKPVPDHLCAASCTCRGKVIWT